MTKPKDPGQLASVVIDKLGGTSAVARLCECKPPSVHEWRTKGFPKPRLQYLRLAHPEAFEGLEDESARHEHATASAAA